jgi:acetyl esterase/lipase
MRIVRRIAVVVFGIIAATALVAGTAWWYWHPQVAIERGVTYGRRGDKTLTFDIFRPSSPNGAAVLVMVSGSWRSQAGSFQPWLVAPVLRRGYTVFAVYHVSQPEATVMEITRDVTRAVRFIRHNAASYGVNPDRFGVTGGSAGGHLGLFLGTRGDSGRPDAADPVDRESSVVQSVAVFYPVADLLNLGPSTENLHDGGPPRSFVQAFGPQSTNLSVWSGVGRDMSPIYHIPTNMPPTLIYHGDADTLVPLEQSERFQAEARRLGLKVDLVVHHGGGHGWLTMPFDIIRFADWFDASLPPVVASK